MYIPFHFIRRFFIKLRLKRVGKGVSFLMGLEIRKGRNISIGNNSVFNSKVLLDGRGGNLIIGNNVDIAQETNIWTLEHDVNSDLHSSSGGDVKISDYVWIASRVTILPGVSIKEGAVVASNSVVTKDVEECMIVGGIPARPLGRRKNKLNYTLHYEPWFK